MEPKWLPEALEGVLVALGAVLAALGALLAALGALLAPLLAARGPSNMEPTWGQHGSRVVPA